MASASDRKRLGAWSAILNPDAKINRRNTPRTVPMEVLSLGFSRTGTSSMQEALGTLGYTSPYHFSSIFENTRDAELWREAIHAKFHGGPSLDWKAHFDGLLGHCGAVTDMPAILFWRELAEAYPEARVVLVEREVGKWVPSCGVLLEGILDPFLGYVLRFTDPFWMGRVIGCGRAWVQAAFGTTDLAGAKAVAVETYRAHYAAVRAGIPADRLLEYELGSGWEPLCEFLGKPVPDVDFPRRNEAKMLEEAFAAGGGKAVKNSVWNVAIILGGLAVLVGVVRSYWP